MISHKENRYEIRIEKEEIKHCFVDVNHNTIPEPMHYIHCYHKNNWISAMRQGITATEFKNMEYVRILKDVITEHHKQRLKQIQLRYVENQISKSYPNLITFTCNNVTINVIETFIDIHSKKYDIYIGERLLRGDQKESHSHEITIEYILDNLHKYKISKYNTALFSDIQLNYINKHFKQLSINIVPMYEFLGSVVKFKDNVIKIIDLDFKFNPTDYLDFEIIESLQDWELYIAMKNKLKYLE